jgi:hypothetical protein
VEIQTPTCGGSTPPLYSPKKSLDISIEPIIFLLRIQYVHSGWFMQQRAVDDEDRQLDWRLLPPSNFFPGNGTIGNVKQKLSVQLRVVRTISFWVYTRNGPVLLFAILALFWVSLVPMALLKIGAYSQWCPTQFNICGQVSASLISFTVYTIVIFSRSRYSAHFILFAYSKFGYA